MKLTSPEFRNQGRIPQRFTCEGQDISPPFEWSEVPEGSATLADGATIAELHRAMEGSVLAEAALVGTYER